eukprot:9965020-Prorocentrum_lima.AAC.1
MTSSLVGSEMCIRDRERRKAVEAEKVPVPKGAWEEEAAAKAVALRSLGMPPQGAKGTPKGVKGTDQEALAVTIASS